MHIRQLPRLLLSFYLILNSSLYGNDAIEDEFYILPDFVVSDDDDKGYYSANTLAGTRTNELTKNIPMTISTVNQEMIDDFKMKTLEDLGNFVPSIEAEGNVYNNNEIRFRGLLTKNQLFEFVPRYSPIDWYNVGRADIIRGSNSLIYGQADPGGKVNLISKQAQLNKNKGSIQFEAGTNDWHKYSFDYNYVINDSTAARYLYVDKDREFDQNYKYQKYTGSTLELVHQLKPSTRLRLHLEKGEAKRSLIGGTFKVAHGPTGLPANIVADPKLADLMSEDFFQHVAEYQEFSGNGISDPRSIYPSGTIYGFVDVNGDNLIGLNYTDSNGNKKYDSGEMFDDVNFDNTYNDSDYTALRRSNQPKLYNLPKSAGILVPDFIATRNDIKKMFRGIDYRNTGTGQGPSSYSNKSFDYIIADIEHSFSDNLNAKLSVAFEDLWDKQLSAGYGSNQLKFSSGYGTSTKVPNYRSLYDFSEKDVNKEIISPFTASLIDLTNANHADIILNVIDQNMDGQYSPNEKELITRNLANRLNANGGYDIGEMFTDELNGIWDEGEYFIDNNGNDLYDEFEPFVDAGNGNGHWDEGEGFIDGWRASNLPQVTEELIKILDKGQFDDVDGDGHWDEGEGFIEQKDGIISHTEIAKYISETLLDLDKTNNQFERHYEVAKLGGRVIDLLDTSHKIYGKSNGYLWNWTKFGGVENNGYALSHILYDVLTDGKKDAPESQAIDTMFNLDRYIDVSALRSQLLKYDSPDDFTNLENLEGFKYVDFDFTSENAFVYEYLADQDEPIPIDEAKGIYFELDKDSFSLEEDGEKLIYDAIPTWVIEQQHEKMVPLDNVEISGAAPGGEFDNRINGNDKDEVDLQRRAMAKEIYKILIKDADDKDSDNEFWDAHAEVEEFFKNRLHEETDYSWIWKTYVQPELILMVGAIREDINYYDPSSVHLDFDNDGTPDGLMPSLSNNVIEVLEPYITRQWQRTINRDENRSTRLTFNFDENSSVIPGKQQFLLGLDFDKRKANRQRENQVNLGAIAYGKNKNLFLNNNIDASHILLDDYFRGRGEIEYNSSIGGQDSIYASNWTRNAKIPLGIYNFTEWKTLYSAESEVKSNGIWFAASGSYFDGRFRSLLGIRRDQIQTDSTHSNFKLRTLDKDKDDFGAIIDRRPQTFKDVIYSPSIGGLFWLNKSIAIFGNYSESVISPDGFQFDAFGQITPPETGKGREVGFKLSSPSNVFNGQLVVFSIDKKNEHRQNVPDPMLKALYPAKNADGTIRTEAYEGTVTKENPLGYNAHDLYDFYFYKDRFGDYVTDENDVRLSREVFNKKGNRIADEEVRSEGIELDFFYNPNNAFSLTFGYAYVDTTTLKSSLYYLEGLTTAGTSDHNFNLSLRYKFNDGIFKNTTIGMNQKYRSKALLSHYFEDLDKDGQADYFPVDVDDLESPGNKKTLYPSYHTLWLEDQYNTDIFVRWGGKIKKFLPYTVFQLNINNIFNNRDLISTGLNNARYTEGRHITLSGGLHF